LFLLRPAPPASATSQRREIAFTKAVTTVALGNPDGWIARIVLKNACMNNCGLPCEWM